MLNKLFILLILILTKSCAEDGLPHKGNYKVDNTTTCKIVLEEVEEEEKQVADATITYTTTVCNGLPVLAINSISSEGLRIRDQYVINSNKLYKLYKDQWTDIWTKIDKTTGDTTSECRAKLKNNKGTIDVKYP